MSKTRKNTQEDSKVPEHIASAKYTGGTRKLNSVVGSFYTFYYRSKTGTVKEPEIVSLHRKGGRVFIAGNGKRYMMGVSLSHVSETVKELVYMRLSRKKVISYKSLGFLLLFLRSSIRVYDIRKVRNLRVIDTSKYIGPD